MHVHVHSYVCPLSVNIILTRSQSPYTSTHMYTPEPKFYRLQLMLGLMGGLDSANL